MKEHSRLNQLLRLIRYGTGSLPAELTRIQNRIPDDMLQTRKQLTDAPRQAIALLHANSHLYASTPSGAFVTSLQMHAAPALNP